MRSEDRQGGEDSGQGQKMCEGWRNHRLTTDHPPTELPDVLFTGFLALKFTQVYQQVGQCTSSPDIPNTSPPK